MVHQHFRLVEPFTVAENVVLGERDVGGSLLLRHGVIASRVEELAERYGMAVDPHARIWQLSVGEQQRVEILKALYREARILILDEPTAVLTPQEAEGLFVTLRAMAAEERTVIFISHKLHEVMAVADRVTVLRGGRAIATVATADVTREELASLMVGRHVDVARHRDRVGLGDVVLEAEGLSARGDRGVEALRDVTLGSSGRGLGRCGRRGQRAARARGGAHRDAAAHRGDVRVAGQPLSSGDPRAAIRAGVAHVPEDRLTTGVAPSLSIAANVVLKSYRGSEVSRGRSSCSAASATARST